MERCAYASIPTGHDDGSSDAKLPPYEWARLSSLQLPVTIDDEWSTLLAAQREKSRLLETQAYISDRISEIDKKIKTRLLWI